jgi:hypothetical protein
MNKLTKLLVLSLFVGINSINADVIKFTNLNAIANQGCNQIGWYIFQPGKNSFVAYTNLTDTNLTGAVTIPIPSGNPNKFMIFCNPPITYSEYGMPEEEGMPTLFGPYTNVIPSKTYKISVFGRVIEAQPQ